MAIMGNKRTLGFAFNFVSDNATPTLVVDLTQNPVGFFIFETNIGGFEDFGGNLNINQATVVASISVNNQGLKPSAASIQNGILTVDLSSATLNSVGSDNSVIGRLIFGNQ